MRVLDEAKALVEQHFAEVALDAGIRQASPDRERFQALEAAGALLTLLVLDKDDQIVGYTVTVIARHVHRDVIAAMNDAIYLHPSLRGSGVGPKLIDATEQAAKARGAKIIGWHAKQGTAFERVLPRLDYVVQDIIFTKEL